jgi:hypothetical protein
MILTEAHDYMDLLLDKADQPYFTAEEKNRFLNIAISDFINFHYQKMASDEDSKKAIAACVNWNSWELTPTEIIDGTNIFDNSYPAFSEKYDEASVGESTIEGPWRFGFQYQLPLQHLYVLSIAMGFYNKNEIIDPATGLPYSGKDEDDVVFYPTISVKSKSTRDSYEDSYSNDPFNNNDTDNPAWMYLENRIVFRGDTSSIRYVNIQEILLPTVGQAFGEQTVGDTTAPDPLVFNEHHQRQIVQIAVEKMTRVDVGLMTPPS